MANDLNRSIKIYIDGSDAQQSVEKLSTAIDKLEKELKDLSTEETDYEAKAKKLQDEINRKTETLAKYQQKVETTRQVLSNLSGATYNQLMAVQRQLRKELADLVPGTERYNQVLEHTRRVSQQVSVAQRAMRVETAAQESVWKRISNGINQYAGTVATFAAAITGVTLKLNQLRELRNEREDAAADVQALTGLDSASIAWLEEQAVSLSTTMTESGVRITQSASEILDAYKLVGSAKPELLTVKEDLNAVTEQTLILASASGMQLKDAVDATTLSLNQFGAGADQAGRFVNVMAAGSKYGSAAVESITKALRNSGVAAASANISIEQTVGLIETLAEKGIKDEVAGTGLKKFFLTLQTGADETNPKVVGLSRALENLAARQLDAAEIKKMFGEEGYNVASVLISETEKVQYYTDAVTATGTAIEQAGIKSDTASAKLAQARNQMNEVGIELMEKLNPALVSAANGFVNWTRHGVDLVVFLVEHRRILLTATTAIVTYTAAVRGVAAAKTLYTRATTLATTVTKGFTTAIKANPWGLIVSGLTAAVAWFTSYNDKTDEAVARQRALNDEMQRTNDLLGRVSDVSTKADNLQFLNDEQKRNLKAEIRQTIRELDNLISERMIANKKWYESERESLMKAAGDNQILQKSYLNGLEHDLKERMEVVAGYLERKRQLEAKLAKLPDDQPTVTETQTQTSGTGDTTDPAKAAAEATKAALQEEKDLYHQHVHELQELYLSQQDSQLQTQADYNEALEQLEIMHLQRMLEISGLSADERRKIENQLMQYKIDCLNEVQEEQNSYLAEQQKKNEEEAELQKKQLEKQQEEEKRQQLERVRTLKQTTADATEAMLGLMSGQQNAFETFSSTIIDITFDMLSKAIEAKIIEATASATAGTVEVASKSYAMPDSVATFGASGSVRTAIITGLMMGALAAAKATLKGLLSQALSSSSSDSSSTGSTQYRTVTQYAEGHYDVIGADDHRTYRGVPYIGPAPTGIVTSPALISESGAELIVNAPDLARLRRHINYPLVMQAIAESRRPMSVVQHSSGSYPTDPDATAAYPVLSPDILRRLTYAIERLERTRIQASVSLSELDSKREQLDKARSKAKRHTLKS